MWVEAGVLLGVLWQRGAAAPRLGRLRPQYCEAAASLTAGGHLRRHSLVQSRRSASAWDVERFVCCGFAYRICLSADGVLATWGETVDVRRLHVQRRGYRCFSAGAAVLCRSCGGHVCDAAVRVCLVGSRAADGYAT